jgi:hypothetical protein
MIPEHEEVFLVEYNTDKYGTISAGYEFSCKGVVDREDVFRNISGQTAMLGSGTFYTSSPLVILPTMGFKLDGVEYKIKRLQKLSVEGEFHHYEVVYG